MDIDSEIKGCDCLLFVFNNEEIFVVGMVFVDDGASVPMFELRG